MTDINTLHAAPSPSSVQALANNPWITVGTRLAMILASVAISIVSGYVAMQAQAYDQMRETMTSNDKVFAEALTLVASRVGTLETTYHIRAPINDEFRAETRQIFKDIAAQQSTILQEISALKTLINQRG